MSLSTFTTLLFPGRIEPSPGRSVAAILADNIDPETGCLILGPDTKVAPTRIDPSCKLIFRKKKKAPSGEVEYEFLGYTVTETQFTQMADFIYSPPVESVHIHTAAISKQVTPATNYNLEGNPTVKREDNEEGTENDSSGVAVLRFRDARPAPTEPTQYMKSLSEDVDASLLVSVQTLFQERAIWQRSSLEEGLNQLGISTSYYRLSHAIRLSAYLFLDGPWRNCYIRFGYDPREDMHARAFQVIDFRDPFFLRDKIYASEQSTTPADIHFRRPPSTRSQLYQLTDIDDPTIQALVSRSATVLGSPDPHTGWLTETEMTSIRNQMKLKADAMRRHESHAQK